MKNHLETDPVLLRTIIDHIPSVIFVRDMTGKIILANKAYSQFFGIEPQHMEGKGQKELYEQMGWIQPSIDIWLQEDKAVVASGKQHTIGEQVNHRNGEVCLYETCKWPIKLTDGDDAVLVISHRIFEPK